MEVTRQVNARAREYEGCAGASTRSVWSGRSRSYLLPHEAKDEAPSSRDRVATDEQVRVVLHVSQ